VEGPAGGCDGVPANGDAADVGRGDASAAVDPSAGAGELGPLRGGAGFEGPAPVRFRSRRARAADALIPCAWPSGPAGRCARATTREDTVAASAAGADAATIDAARGPPGGPGASPPPRADDDGRRGARGLGRPAVVDERPASRSVNMGPAARTSTERLTGTSAETNRLAAPEGLGSLPSRPCIWRPITWRKPRGGTRSARPAIRRLISWGRGEGATADWATCSCTATRSHQAARCAVGGRWTGSAEGDRTVAGASSRRNRRVDSGLPTRNPNSAAPPAKRPMARRGIRRAGPTRLNRSPMARPSDETVSAVSS
jgi:hypothetical protein